MSQLPLLDEFAEEFFTRIEDAVCNRGHSISTYIYMLLQPNIHGTTEEIGRFEKMLKEFQGRTVEQKREGNDRLIKWLKESIEDLKEKKASREMSQKWDEQK